MNLNHLNFKLISISKRLLVGCVTGISGLLLGGAVLSGASAESVRTEIAFLHTNDVYQAGAVASLVTLLDEERDRNENTITTFGGDLFSPSVISGFTKGAHMVELYNMAALDYATVGNHEFDFGPDEAMKRFSESKFSWLAANLLDTNREIPAGLKQGVIETVGDVKVGIFGLAAPNTPEVSSPGEGLVFIDWLESARRMSEGLRKNGAQVVVVLSHLTLPDEIEMARQLPGINLVLSGDDHVATNYMIGNTLIVEGPSDAAQLMVVQMHVDQEEKDGEIDTEVSFDWYTRRNDDTVKVDDAMAKAVAKYEEQLNEVLSEEIASIDLDVDTRRNSVRASETSFGNLVADVMRQVTGADFGLTNGGGIRGNKVYQAGSMLTRRDILTELPFGNVTVVLELTGAEIKEALENGVSQVEERSGRFPQVSNLEISYDPDAEPGDRILGVSTNGSPLASSQKYTLATNDFLARGGDGYEVFASGKTILGAIAGQLMANQVTDALKKGAVEIKSVEGRITSIR